jgi:hypothetical protein
MAAEESRIQGSTTRTGLGRGIDAIAPLGLAVAIFVALLATSRDYALAFDEAFTIDREITLAQWFAEVLEPPAGSTRADYFSRAVLEHYWRFSRHEPDGHPPFYALLGVAGWWCSRGWLDPLAAYRFGPIALTAATSGMVCWFFSRRQGRVAGVTAAIFLVCLPRTFAHAHYAHYDMPVTCLWLLAQMAFLKSLRSPVWTLAFGITLGLAAGTKLTGWFAVAPPLGWWLMFEAFGLARTAIGRMSIHGPNRNAAPRRPLDFAATRALALGIPLAGLTLYAIQPPWWSAPWAGLERFLVSNLTRDQTVPVTSLYLGTVYRFALPWHNTIVLTLVTTPILVVALGFLGIGVTVARTRTRPENWIWVEWH